MKSIFSLIYDTKFTDNICCLCLSKSQENKHFKLYDEESKSNTDFSISVMLLTVLGSDVIKKLASESMCSDCIKSLENCHIFIKNCQKNIDNLCKVVQSLSDSIARPLTQKNKTLFVIINNDYSVEKHVTSNKCTLQTAINMFNDSSYSNDLDTATRSKHIESSLKKKKSHNKKFKTTDMMLDGNGKDFVCKICRKSFQRHYNLRAHFMRIHAPKQFPCNICNKKFATKALMEQHRTESHASVVCSECGKSFTNLSTLRTHETSHKLRLVCSDCGRVYKRQITYKNHKEMNICGQNARKPYKDAKYVCDICGKKYCLKASLRVHIQFEHGNGKVYACTWCDKKFSAQSFLKTHSVTHTQEKNFICSICFSKFVSKESLVYHMRIHTGERPYRCDQCECRFISASRKIEHLRRYHSNKESCKKCFQKNLPAVASNETTNNTNGAAPDSTQ